MRTLEVRRLGRMAYADALALQQQLVDQRRAGAVGDLLLLVEHPSVLTLGVRGDSARSHILASDDELAARHIDVFETRRGGDVTYHGPGQIVGYPIIDLNPDRRDVHKYVRDIEEALIRALAPFGIEGRRVDGLTGVWVGASGREEKIAAIGIRRSPTAVDYEALSESFLASAQADLDATGRRLDLRLDVRDAVRRPEGAEFGLVVEFRAVGREPAIEENKTEWDDAVGGSGRNMTVLFAVQVTGIKNRRGRAENKIRGSFDVAMIEILFDTTATQE